MKAKTAVGYVLIVTALPVESDAVKRLAQFHSTETSSGGMLYEIGAFRNVGLVLVESGAGNVDAAIEVERAIEKFNPRYLFFIGVAGGIKDVRIGDVVAATRIYSYESGKASPEFLARPKMGESNYRLVQLAKAVARSEKWKSGMVTPLDANVHISPLVAGEKVISSVDASELDVIRKNYSDAVAVEMEGYGVLRVGYSREHVRMIVIRGISDLLSGKEGADAHGCQPAAATNAASFAFQMISDLMDESRTIPQTTWDALEDLAVSLYPIGPTQLGIWSRAGGDLSRLELMQSGKGSWHNAITQLQNGGGGNEITLVRLVTAMLEDFPNNSDLHEIARSAT